MATAAPTLPPPSPPMLRRVARALRRQFPELSPADAASAAARAALEGSPGSQRSAPCIVAAAAKRLAERTRAPRGALLSVEAPDEDSPDARLVAEADADAALDRLVALVGGDPAARPRDPFRVALGVARLRGVTLEAIGDACGVSRQAVDGWCRGSEPAPGRQDRALAALRALSAEAEAAEEG